MSEANVLHLYDLTSNTPVLQAVPRSPETITQLEIGALLSLRNRSRQLDEQIATAEQALRTRLEAGALIELGSHSAELKESHRRSVSWREVAERLADRLYGHGKGDGYCERVLRGTKPSRIISLLLS
jgi:hypothetical protein